MATILLIDDDPEIRELISRFLTADGYEVVVADGVNNALGLISNGAHFSAAIVDFWLGENDAVGLLDAIHAKSPGVPIVMISGGGGRFSIETTQAVGEISGVAHFLQKPFRKSELLSVLSKAIQG